MIAMIGAVISRHRPLGRFGRRELGMLLHHPLDVLDHDDGVVDDNADGEHDGQQRNGIGRIADGQQRDERADQADRHRQGRDQRGAHAAEEQEDDEHDENERLDQRLLHLVDRVGDEDRRIVGDLPGQIVGETLLAAPPACCEPPSAVAIALAPGDW